MKNSVKILLAVWGLVPCVTNACNSISVLGDLLGNLTFSKLPLSVTESGSTTFGRASYRTTDDSLFLYFEVQNLEFGSGRWVINHEMGVVGAGIAFVGEYF